MISLVILKVRYIPLFECGIVFGIWYFCDLLSGISVVRQFLWAKQFRNAEQNSQPNANDCTVLHISDLHIVVDNSTSRVEACGAHPKGNCGISAAFNRYLDEMHSADAITIAGDITDTGTDQEWTIFLSLLETLPEDIRNRVFIVPGNHDLNFVAPISESFTTAEADDYAGRRRKDLLFARVLNLVQGSRCEVIRTIENNEVELLPMSDIIRPYESGIENFLSGKDPNIKDYAMGDWEEQQLFPYVWRLETRAGKRIALIGINTCALSDTVLGNAFGTMEFKRMVRLKALVSHLVERDYFPIVVGHHHPFVRPIALPHLGMLQNFKSRFMSAWMGLASPRAFVRGLERTAPHGFVYLHGHRHVGRIFSGGTASAPLPLFISSPSLLFGDESKPELFGRAALLSLSISSPTGLQFTSSYSATARFV